MMFHLMLLQQACQRSLCPSSRMPSASVVKGRRGTGLQLRLGAHHPEQRPRASGGAARAATVLALHVGRAAHEEAGETVDEAQLLGEARAAALLQLRFAVLREARQIRVSAPQSAHV